MSTDNSYCWGLGCGNGGWSSWGRWILIVCVVVFFCMMVGMLYRYSSRRAMQGRPLQGTTWMVPAHHSSHRNARNEPDPVPPYIEGMGDHDAGFYDAHGNFIANNLPSYEEHLQPPAKAVRRASTNNMELDDFAPPPGPPPMRPNQSMV